MNQEAILLPVLALGLLTFAMMLRMGRLRFKAVERGDIPARYFKLNRGADMPDYLAKTTRNFHNLLEVPLLFYVLTLMIFVTQRVDTLYLGLAWAFVASRVVHSAIHVTVNKLLYRAGVFILGCLLLMIMWVRFGLQVLST